MAQVYPDAPSVKPGDVMPFHVSTGTAKFRIDLYRQGASLQQVGSQSFNGGGSAAIGSHDSDWGWPAFAVHIPADWRSGVYLALCVEDGASQQAADIDDPANRFAQAVFVVTSKAPGTDSCILYKLPTFTYAAYNELADPPGSLYTGAGLKVTMHRPGCGAGADPWDHFIPDIYDPDTFRQTFAHWDQKFIQWLEANNYVVDYCTDLDVHQNTGNLLGYYHLVLSVGHDEYWSVEMRNNLEAYIGAGGNVAFFSGNVCWWRVHVTDNGTALVCDKSPHVNVPGLFDQWWTGQNQRPENSVTGVSYRGAGGQWTGARPDPAGYTVQYAGHWLYSGVNQLNGGAIQDGDVIGDDDALVGYECDGAALAPPMGNWPLVATGADGTPHSFLVLGVARVPDFEDAESGADSTATMGVYSRGGIVFTAATTDWARVLWSGQPQVTQITCNVLDRLRSRTVAISGLGTPCSNHAVVEGAKLKFHVDTSKLLGQGTLSYEWSASAGTSGATDQATFELTLPSPPVTVTITVSIDAGTDCPAFGSLTFTPMTYQEFLFAQLICRLRQLILTSAIYRSPLQGVREGNRWFVDPLWDPIKGFVGPQLGAADLRRVAVSARGLLELVDRLSSLRQAGNEP